jgi:hypothetical protein
MKRVALTLLLLATVAASSDAGVRRFTFVYESTTSRAGDVDVENWVTLETHTPNDHDFRAVTFRHEIEIGLTDHLQASVYLADWQYERGAGTSYTDSAVELIYSVTNPVADPVGVAIYQEYKGGRRLFEWESKVIAQKNFGRFITAYNATLEAEWEGRGLHEQAGELQQSVGVSYEVDPRFSVGVECVHEIAFPEWSKANRGVFFAGPNASVRAGNVFLTVTALGQLTSAGDEPDLQLRAVFGAMF